MTVLALVAEGLTNKQIARRLGISVSRVKNLLSGPQHHDQGIYARIGVENRVQAALWYQTHGN